MVMPVENDIAGRTAALIGQLSGLEGPLLPILHAVQHEFGHVPEEALPVIAERLNLSRAEVHGVVSFYHDFRREPAGRHVIKVCRAEACQAAGGDASAARLLSILGLSMGQTSADGNVTVEAVYCLGLCACAPAVLVDGKPSGRFDEDKAGRLAAQFSPRGRN